MQGAKPFAVQIIHVHADKQTNKQTVVDKTLHGQYGNVVVNV